MLTGTLCLIGYGYLAVNSQEYGQAELAHLLTVGFGCAGLSFITWGYFHYTGKTLAIGPMLAFAMLFRLVGCMAFPVLEDDFFRYLWDGMMLVEQGNPYGVAPAEFFASDQLDDRFETILNGINYPELPTIYGPVCQLVFALAYWIAPGEIWPLPVIFTLADLAIILALLKLAAPGMVLLYAWSPLIIKEFAFSAHPDVLGVALMMLALLASHRRHFYWAAVLIALAAAVKIFALIALPFLLGYRWKAWAISALTGLVVALPFGVLDAWLPKSLGNMATEWLFNAPVYLLLKDWLPINGLKIGLLLTFVIGWASYLFISLKQSIAVTEWRGDWVFAGFLICLPVLNPWYFVWVLPFAVLHPGIWAWVASASLLLSYASGLNLYGDQAPDYQIPPLVIALEFGLIVLTVGFDIARRYLGKNLPA